MVSTRATGPLAVSNHASMSRVGPSVISRNKSDAGYLVVPRKEIHAGACGRRGGVLVDGVLVDGVLVDDALGCEFDAACCGFA